MSSQYGREGGGGGYQWNTRVRLVAERACDEAVVPEARVARRVAHLEQPVRQDRVPAMYGQQWNQSTMESVNNGISLRRSQLLEPCITEEATDAGAETEMSFLDSVRDQGGTWWGLLGGERGEGRGVSD